MPCRGSIRAFCLALAGPALWFLFLGIIYGIESLACTPAMAMPAAVRTSSMVIAVLTAAAALTIVAGRQLVAWRAGGGFLAGIGLTLTGLSVGAMLWVALPLIIVIGCSPTSLL